MPLSLSTTPAWYGLEQLANRAEENSRIPFSRYTGNRIAPFNPQQQEGFTLASQETANPIYRNNFNEATTNIRNAAGQNILPQINPYIQGATANPTINAAQYMNPYQDRVVNNIATLGNRNLQENILPNVRDRFINAGQYGSTGHQNLTNRAIRDTQEAITNSQGNLLHSGYNTALQTAIGQQERNLQAGSLTGRTLEDQTRRQLTGAEGLQNVSQAQQGQNLRNAGLLTQLGGQQQQQSQNALNTAYQDFQNELNYPHLQVARLSDLQRGLPVSNSQSFVSNPVAPVQASPYTQGAGLLAGLVGSYNQRPGQGFSEGGHATAPINHIRHYAEGGRVLGPIQRGVNDALDTSEIRHLRSQAMQLNQPQVDPFWSAIARAGFNVAANRQPGVMAAIGEGANAGLSEYQNQLAHQDNRALQSAKIMELIDNTRRIQEENNRKHQFEVEKFGQRKKEFGATHGLSMAREQREKEEHEWKKEHKDIWGDSKSGYFKYNPENGSVERIAGSEPQEEDSKEELAAYKKANSEGLEQARSTIHIADNMEKTLEELEKINKELKTGGYRGIIGQYSPNRNSPVGQETKINRFKKLTAKLQLLEDALSSKGRPSVTRLQLVGQTKSLLTDTTEANDINIKEMKYNLKNDRDRSKFITSNVKLGKKNNVHVADVETAYDDYLSGMNKKGSEKLTPKQYLERHLKAKRGNQENKSDNDESLGSTKEMSPEEEDKKRTLEEIYGE